MKYYKNTNGDITAYAADGSQDQYIPGDLVALTGPEVDALLNPAPVAQPVPAIVSMRQARLALLAAGQLSAVDAAIASLPSPQKEAAQIEWDYSNTVERSMPLVASLATILGLDEAALDALFTTASKL